MLNDFLHNLNSSNLNHSRLFIEPLLSFTGDFFPYYTLPLSRNSFGSSRTASNVQRREILAGEDGTRSSTAIIISITFRLFGCCRRGGLLCWGFWCGGWWRGLLRNCFYLLLWTFSFGLSFALFTFSPYSIQFKSNSGHNLQFTIVKQFLKYEWHLQSWFLHCCPDPPRLKRGCWCCPAVGMRSGIVGRWLTVSCFGWHCCCAEWRVLGGRMWRKLELWVSQWFHSSD